MFRSLANLILALALVVATAALALFLWNLSQNTHLNRVPEAEIKFDPKSDAG